jgi:uncharacterized protein YbjT (DUF2867 family)
LARPDGSVVHDQLVLVVGGTRGTGLLAVQRLVRDGIAVRVMARDTDRVRARLRGSCDVVAGDITKPHTLPSAIDRATHILFTAGIRSGRPATERRIRTTEFDGVRNTLDAARAAGFNGRFVYMTSSGVGTPSLAATLLNVYKGNTLIWRYRAEEVIRASGIDYAVVRAGVLLNRPGGRRAIVVTQTPLPLSIRYRIARADVADALVCARDHPRASRASFDVVWGAGPRTTEWPALLDSLASAR